MLRVILSFLYVSVDFEVQADVLPKFLSYFLNLQLHKFVDVGKKYDVCKCQQLKGVDRKKISLTPDIEIERIRVKYVRAGYLPLSVDIDRDILISTIFY